MTRVILCGITYRQIIEVAQERLTLRDSAKRLGVSERYLHQRLKDLGMMHWFTRVYKQRQRCITADDIRQVASEGYTRSDAAYILGVSPAYLKDLINLWDLRDCWTVTKGKASWVARRGYAN